MDGERRRITFTLHSDIKQIKITINSSSLFISENVLFEYHRNKRLVNLVNESPNALLYSIHFTCDFLSFAMSGKLPLNWFVFQFEVCLF